MKWAFHEKPAIAYSVAIGCLGPVSLVGLPPLRRAMGDEDPIRIPLSYPSEWAAKMRTRVRTDCDLVPEGPRKAVPAGYDDE